jgi:uncharacterized phage protein (TIGR01671 family)
MRDIQFRAWDKKRENWCFGDAYVGSMIYSHDVEFSSSPTVDLGLCELAVFFSHISEEDSKDRFILMQYTGLTDKDGKEIYEGDIVATFVPDNRFKAKRKTDRTLMVEMKTVEVGDDWGNDYEVFGYFTDSNMSFKDVTVIGNIYENPELIQKEKK